MDQRHLLFRFTAGHTNSGGEQGVEIPAHAMPVD